MPLTECARARATTPRAALKRSIGAIDTLTPMDPDSNRHLPAVFDAHDEAFSTLRVADTKMGAAIAAMGHAIHVQNEAI